MLSIDLDETALLSLVVGALCPYPHCLRLYNAHELGEPLDLIQLALGFVAMHSQLNPITDWESLMVAEIDLYQSLDPPLPVEEKRQLVQFLTKLSQGLLGYLTTTIPEIRSLLANRCFNGLLPMGGGVMRAIYV